MGVKLPFPAHHRFPLDPDPHGLTDLRIEDLWLDLFHVRHMGSRILPALDRLKAENPTHRLWMVRAMGLREKSPVSGFEVDERFVRVGKHPPSPPPYLHRR